MKRLILRSTVAVLLMVVVGSCVYGWPYYRKYKESRGLRMALFFLAKGDFSNASVSARQVLQINPANIGACRIIAELAERSRSPAALEWTHRVADLAPTPANKLKLVACALRFERPPYALASRTLLELENSRQTLPAFHVLSAELALKMNRVDEAATHFEQASKLEPTNCLHRFNLAILQLQSTNLWIAARARLSLEALSTNGSLDLLALRWLVADDLHRNDVAKAELLSLRLLERPCVHLEDRLQHLAILQRMINSPANAGVTAPNASEKSASGRGASKQREFSDNLRAIQVGSATNLPDLYLVCQWMGSHGLADNALEWLGSLDPKLLGVQPMPLARANLYLAKADWSGLETVLTDQKWADLEFLRQAMLARAAWARNQTVVAQTRWASAIRCAADHLGSLNLLLGLVQEWRQDPEEILWQIARRFPRELWALAELERRYARSRDTRGLNSVFTVRLDSTSRENDSTNRNNFAATSMLLGINLPRAHATARELYRSQPADPIIASTYAYSLHLQGRTADGLAVFARLNPDSLETPPVALYYGLLLAASGDGAAARYLSLVKAPNLLPEEIELLATARTHKALTRRPGA